MADQEFAAKMVEAMRARGDEGAPVRREHGGPKTLAREGLAEDAPLGRSGGGACRRREGDVEARELVVDAAARTRLGTAKQRLDPLPELAHRGVSDDGIRRERAGKLTIQSRREVGPIAKFAGDGRADLRELRPLVAEHARDHSKRAVVRARSEGLGTRERLVEHRREREHVGLNADAVVAHLVLLGRRISERGAGDRDGPVRVEVRQLDEPEVGDLGDLLPLDVGEQDVRGLEIAMNDALLVDGVERARDLLHQPADARDRQAESAVRLDDFAERLALDVLEDDERQRHVGAPRGSRAAQAWAP